MSIFETFRHRLAERRTRRRRYAETLEILSLPVEIQRDIVRPEAETEKPRAPRDRQRCERQSIGA